MSTLAFTLHLMRIGPELRIAETECRWQNANGQTLWISEMAEVAAGLPNKESFEWTKPARALLLLLLRDLPQPPEQRMGLLGPENSHAASLYELVIRGRAKAGGKTWLQKMFSDPKDQSERPLSVRLFHHRKPSGRFFVTLGPDWDEAAVKVFLDGRQVPPTEFAALAQSVERWDALAETEPPLIAMLHLLVRDLVTGRFTSVSEKPSLLPVKHGDEFQLHVEINQSAFTCLAWVDSKGEPFPLYPWDWKGIRDKAPWGEPIDFKPGPRVIVPEPGDSGEHFLSVKKEAGLETIVVMISRAPPNDELVQRIPELLRLQDVPSPAPQLTTAVWSQFSRDSNEPKGPSKLRLRGGPVVLRRKNPIRVLHENLGNSLVKNFDEVVVLTFPNKGGER